MYFVNDTSSTDHQAMRDFVSDRLDVLSGKGEKKIIFLHEGRLWNFGGTHKIHKRFLTGSNGLERNRETMWKRSTHICFDHGH